MDFQNRVGSKTGGGGPTSYSESNRDRRERLRKLALETIDIAKDPYFMRNHLGTYECKLCLTLHNNEGSYLAHTQGKKHQSNLSRRAAKEAKKNQTLPALEKPRVEIRKFVKIGRPGYKVTKQADPETTQQSLLFQIDYPGIVEGIRPKYRVMAAYEQHIEPPDKAWQYLLFAAEPYETIAFKIPSREVDNTEGKLWNEWNPETKQFFLQFSFKIDSHPKISNLPPPAQLAAQGQHHKLQPPDNGALHMDTTPHHPPPPGPTHNPALLAQPRLPNLMPMQQPIHRPHFPMQPHFPPRPIM
ncbi:Splicing factor 3A subunit 2-like [Oopsacas minuta]|uniref:Splicing factor 3A subunit 2 n=1 Tax=Oopsacas minuta TaxID=111878 RepID=A0AAV7JQ91_9METZ|nr:Splicing factor 3A subunit 2-like [Oopsacas minuta]